MKAKHLLEPKRYLIRGRRTITSASHTAEDAIPLLRLRSDWPQFRNYAQLAAKKREQLLPYYDDYVSRVSIDWMAISLELAVFLAVSCDVFRPRTILDLGSGFSSFVFRQYMLNASLKPVVWSVDDDPEWLERTRAYLMEHDLSADRMSTWDAFTQQGVDAFDLILHDLGSMEVRGATLEKVFTLASPGGTVVLDDMHKPDYVPCVKRVLRERRYRSYSLKPHTRDKMGRYSLLVAC